MGNYTNKWCLECKHIVWLRNRHTHLLSISLQRICHRIVTHHFDWDLSTCLTDRHRHGSWSMSELSNFGVQTSHIKAQSSMINLISTQKQLKLTSSELSLSKPRSTIQTETAPQTPRTSSHPSMKPTRLLAMKHLDRYMMRLVCQATSNRTTKLRVSASIRSLTGRVRIRTCAVSTRSSRSLKISSRWNRTVTPK